MFFIGDVKITEDFVKVEIHMNSSDTTEFHMYPTRKMPSNTPVPTNNNHKSRDPNKLNIVMLMIDSLSHASGERYLKKTYERLSNDPDTVILKVNILIDFMENYLL